RACGTAAPLVGAGSSGRTHPRSRRAFRMNLRKSWKFSDGVLLVGLSALAIFAAADIWQNIFEIGLGDEEQSHILIAPVVVVWLAWLRRDRLRLTPHGPSLLGP